MFKPSRLIIKCGLFSKREVVEMKIRLFQVPFCCLTGLIAVLNWGCSSQKGPLSFVAANDVETIELRTRQTIECAAQTVSSTDRTAIEAFLSVVHSAQPTKDHKCAHTLEVTLKQKRKHDVSLRVLRGHDSKYHEFRYEQKIYRADRSEFASALTNLGASDLLNHFRENEVANSAE